MYCPNCAAAVPEGQKFCRSCGLALGLVAQIVAGHAPMTEPDQTAVESLEKLHHRREKLMRRGLITVIAGLMIGCLMVMAAGLQGYDPIFKTLIVELAGLAGLFLFAGSGLITYASSLPKVAASPEAPLKSAETTKKMSPEPHRDLIASVTEDTTETLKSLPADPVRDTAR